MVRFRIRPRLLLRSFLLTLAPWLVPPAQAADEPVDRYAVGVAQIDITPKHPVRLNGFGFRRSESEGVTQRIHAKALAIDDGRGDPALLITVDILGIPDEVTRELARRLQAKRGLKPVRLAVTATHTHTAPMLKGANQTLFGVPIPTEHLAHIDRYTAEFQDKLEKVALQALENCRPSRLTWGVGRVNFAANRRTRGGPVDHDLPVLLVRDRDREGKVRAVYCSYACHCVTLSDNRISGDWAGYAQEAIEDAFPGAVALVSVGCGADANPSTGVTGDKSELASRQGLEVAREVKRLADGFLAPVSGPLTAVVKTIELPLAAVPGPQEWEARAKRNDATGYHARVQLERLDRKEALRAQIAYPIQSWSFGDELAMIFLPGEVVVDYSLRLKRELDGQRLWVNAYANDAPCYIPSERVLKEGGYEGGGAMIYYDLPGPFKPGLEDAILAAVHEQLDKGFAARYDSARTQGTRPLSPQQSLAAIRVKEGLAVDLAAAEPHVVDPVAIDFGPDGRLWVVEMIDYPAGRAGKFEPAGRVRVLESTRGDGIFDKATVFLDNIPFPTGITVWRNGVLVCAAPDILYAEDSQRDGKADVVRKLYTGFGTDNYQARVNSLTYGLDGWIYGSCGLFGGNIRSVATGKVLALGDRDFRIRPDTGEIEPATGRTQQGRVRDDWGNWFGCDNSTLLRHYALADHYLRRNPLAAAPDASVLVPDYPNPNRLFPGKADMQLFKLSGPPGQTTAACGLGIYRDDRLGPEFTGDAFTCEPVNLIIHRLRLTPRQSTFSGRRAADETNREFLASEDGWFRPVQVRTGPDGALWVVDIYRFVIEHPRWIPPEDLAKLDVRAGSGMGRLYRVRAKDRPLRPWPRLDKLDTAGLVAALDTPGGWQRDLATQMLLWKPDPAAVGPLDKLARDGGRPETRLHALAALDGLGRLSPDLLRIALEDAHPGVRRHAVRLAERHVGADNGLGLAVLKAAEDPDAQVRLQAAYSLGAWNDARAARALASLALRHAEDPFLTAAVLSSLTGDNVAEVLAGVFTPPSGTVPPSLAHQLLSLAATMDEGKALTPALALVTRPRDGRYQSWQMAAIAGVLDAGDRRGRTPDKLPVAQLEAMRPLLTEAGRLVLDDKASEADRLAALPLLGRDPATRDDDLARLARLLSPAVPPAVQSAAVTTLGRLADERVPTLLTAGWRGHSPALKAQVLDTLLSRDAWQHRLLDALAKNEVPAAEVDASRRRRLLTHKDPSVRTAASKVFAGAVNPDREKVVEEFQIALTGAGDRPRGKAVFAKTCATCHLLEGVGHAVGPDLAVLANRTPQYLLTEILDPNKNVDSRYLEYQAITKAGRAFTGRLAGETATTVILLGPQGKEETILRADLEELTSSGRSLMPEGLEKELSKKDVADLLAYLTNGATAAKRFPGNEPAVVKPVAGRLTLRAQEAEIRGEQIAFESPHGNVGLWHGMADHVVWRVDLDKVGEFDVYLDYACHDSSAGNAFALEGAEPTLRGKVAGTGTWEDYRRVKLGTLRLKAGPGILTLRPDGDHLENALMDLRALDLVPKGTAPDAP